MIFIQKFFLIIFFILKRFHCLQTSTLNNQAYLLKKLLLGPMFTLTFTVFVVTFTRIEIYVL